MSTRLSTCMESSSFMPGLMGLSAIMVELTGNALRLLVCTWFEGANVPCSVVRKKEEGHYLTVRELGDVLTPL